MKQNNSTELLGHSFVKSYNRNGSPDPQTPRLEFLVYFYRAPTDPLKDPKRGFFWAIEAHKPSKRWGNMGEVAGSPRRMS